jgi:hypothetical protein
MAKNDLRVGFYKKRDSFPVLGKIYRTGKALFAVI